MAVTFRGLRLATQFLTRVPVPVVRDISPLEFSRSSVWFPFVGLFIGALVSVLIYICAHRNATLATAIGLLTWVWTTGAFHLDGLADLTDALAASHRDKEKFLAVLADPHVGAFGVVSIVLMLILKATALSQISLPALFALPLIPAWARLGPLAWSRWLKPLKPGHGERFSWQLNVGWIVFWTIVLLAASALLAPILCLAPVAIAGWGLWLNWRLGGTTGDCLGAGVEVTELVLLYALVLLPPA
jgi:adenosylcobinamide-GDP ribazoletransferase